MTRLRIVVMTNRFGDVGTHPQLSRLALSLKASGHDVRAVSLAPPGTLAGVLAEAGIGTEIVDASRRGSLPRVVVRLAGHFRRWRPDVVIAFLYESIIPSRVAGRLGSVPTVISSIRNEYFGPRYRELVMRVTDRLATRTVVNSGAVARSLVRRHIVTERRLVVIPNGQQVDSFRSSAEIRRSMRNSIGVDDDTFLWLAIGRLTEQKDYPNLFRAFSETIEALPRSKLVVVGRGVLADELAEAARRLGLGDRVAFLGFRNDIPSLLAASDALVMASRYEGMPNAVMEAFAAGLPVVGTDVGGTPELVHDGVNGYLVPAANPRALATAMLRLGGLSVEERRRMGALGRQLVEDRYDLGTVMDTWRTLVESIARPRDHG
jgi:glycosyltransferase involved in cell wall biosynthesis